MLIQRTTTYKSAQCDLGTICLRGIVVQFLIILVPKWRSHRRQEARDAQALAARNRELALRQQAARDVNAAAGAGLPKHQARHLPAPLPGVIGTPRQWAADAPLRRPPPCISDPVCERGVWADPDPTAKPDEHDYDGAAARQAQRRRTDDDQVLDTW